MTRCSEPRRRALGVLAAGALAPFVHPAFAQGAFPQRPVRLVVGYAPGGLPDTVARFIGNRLGELWKQQVVVDNKPGANTTVAAEFLIKSAPDGYTLLVSDSSTVAINPFIYQKLPYDAERDLVPIALAARAPLFLAVHPSLPANSLGELVALAKEKPGSVSYGSSGIGSTHHLCSAALAAATGIELLHVPYKGTGQSVPALVGGQVQLVFSAYPSLAPHVKSGRIKFLAVNSLRRSPLAPEVPTIAETLIPGFDFAPTIGFLGPRGIPAELVAQIARDVGEALKDPELLKTLANAGVEGVGEGAAPYTAQLRGDSERYSRAIRIANVKAE